MNGNIYILLLLQTFLFSANYYVETTGSDNASGYNVNAGWLHSTDAAYLQFSADNASVFYFNQASDEADRTSNSVWLFKLTKQ